MIKITTGWVGGGWASEQASSLRSTTNEPRAREGSLTVPQNDSVLPWGSTSLGNETSSGVGKVVRGL